MMPPTKITENEPDKGVDDPFGNGAQGAAETATMQVTRDSASAPEGTVAPPPTQPAGVTPSLGVAAGSDHCAVCGASMAPDQRYCVECGERRGQARFSAPLTNPSAGPVAPDRRPASRGSRWSPGATLIAGVATLLLALGIGVLIGRSGTSSSPSGNSKVQVVTVGGGNGGATPATAASNSNPTSTPAAGSGGASNKGHKKTAKTSTAASQSSAAATANTVTQQPPSTVTVGARGSGAGYQHHHFTGNFFGGGG